MCASRKIPFGYAACVAFAGYAASPAVGLASGSPDLSALGLFTAAMTSAVDIELRVDTSVVAVGDTVDVGVYAVSDDGTLQSFSGIKVVLMWNSTFLRLIEAIDNGPHAWSFRFGLSDDSRLDGLNDSLLDGNALFEAASFTSASAGGDGLLVATLRFAALSGTAMTQVGVVPAFGQYSQTQVLAPGNINVTGNLGTASVTVGAASLRATDMTMPAGRTAEAWVYGSITGLSTFGLTVLLELVPRAGASGTVTFTPAPPVDVVQRGDPWPGAGLFSPFDTENSGFSGTLNGSVDDDGSFLGDPVTFDGPLTGFGVVSSNDAAGVWDLRLSTTGGDSGWEGLNTTLIHGTLRIVNQGDGNGDTGIDLRDFSEFQACYTGNVVTSAQPAYSLAPERRCVVYDFDGNGVIDDSDFQQFSDAVSGPVQ